MAELGKAMHGIDDPAVEAAVGVYVKLLRASRAVVGRVEKRLASVALTPTQFGVLEALLHKGPLTHRDLSRLVLTSPGNMTDVVDKLCARGLVTRIRDTEDRRSVHVELAELGRCLIEGLFPHHAVDIARAMNALTAEELATLDGLLRKLGMAAAQV
jgi:MarR family 2-MHQ and catechol resistance regulon transcriptional repressor